MESPCERGLIIAALKMITGEKPVFKTVLANYVTSLFWPNAIVNPTLPLCNHSLKPVPLPSNLYNVGTGIEQGCIHEGPDAAASDQCCFVSNGE